MLFQSLLEPFLAFAQLGNLPANTANASALATYVLPELPYAYDVSNENGSFTVVTLPMSAYGGMVGHWHCCLLNLPPDTQMQAKREREREGERADLPLV